MYTRIANDMGNAVSLGTSGAGVNLYYCAKEFGRVAIPGSDGFCGPDDGPQCTSCARFTKCVPANFAEIARLRADKEEYSRILRRRDTEHDKESGQLRKELDLQKKMVRELQAANKTGEKRIRELESAGGGADDEWTRECNSTKVWPRVYQAVGRYFHTDKTSGHEDREKFDEFFKLTNAKNEAITGKGLKSAAECAREEKEAVAHEEREKAAGEKTAYEGRTMNAEMKDILAAWGLQSEESWLLEKGVVCVNDFTFLEDDEIKGRDGSLKHLLAAMKARK